MHITISNRKIYINLWDKVENPKGLIQVIHGMAEYGERYEELAKHLNEKGYIVIASDHFGHKNSIDSHYGEQGENGFHTYIEDEIYISKFFKEKYEIPIHIIGHSMGSFITQYIIRKDLDYITSYTITGSNYLKNSKFFLGRYVLKLLSNFRKLKEDKLIDKILFGNFNDRFEKRTSFDWLSKNQRNVDTYIEDSHCGLIYPTEFYVSFAKALWHLHEEKKFIHLKNKKNILILSGKEDPVGDYGKGVEKLKEFYIKNGFNVEFELYEMLRHEILQENIKEEIFSKISSFIEKN